MKSCFALSLFGAMLVVSTSSSSARGALVTIIPSQDNSIYSENNNSNGAGQGIFVGRTAGGGVANSLRRALIQFDIASSIPAGSTINSVTLQLQRVIAGPMAGSEVLELRPLTAAWGEGLSFGVGKGDLPTANDATWNYRLYSTQLWTNPGGDFGATSGTTQLDPFGSQFVFSSQTGMVGDVQNWLDNPASNFGWLLKYADEVPDSNARMFSSRETGVASDRPALTIDYVTTVPEPGSYLLIGGVALIASGYRPIRRPFRTTR